MIGAEPHPNISRRLSEFDALVAAAPAALDAIPGAVYLCDGTGMLVRYNREAVELWGRDPRLHDPSERFCGSFALYHMDGRPLRREDTPMATALKTAEPARNFEVVMERPDGRRFIALVNIRALRDDEGRIQGAINCFQDITARKAMETELLRSKEDLAESGRRMHALLDAMPAAIYTTDQDGRVNFFNQAAIRLAGHMPKLGETKWCVSWRLYRPDGTFLPHEDCPMAVALKEGQPIMNAEIMVERPDGSRIPALAYPTPLRDGSGRLTGAVNMLVDIADRKQAEIRQKLLVDELNHRVKNTLASVQSIAALTARHAPDLGTFVGNFEARLRALAKAHDLLTQRHWEGANLEDIVAEVLAPYAALEGNRIRIRVQGGIVTLPPRLAVSLTMILHELATNANKYGGLSNASGELALRWQVAARSGPPHRLELEWVEQAGQNITPPKKRGFGTRIIERTIVADLGGELDLRFEPSGLFCRFRVPLPDWERLN